MIELLVSVMEQFPVDSKWTFVGHGLDPFTILGYRVDFEDETITVNVRYICECCRDVFTLEELGVNNLKRL